MSTLIPIKINIAKLKGTNKVDPYTRLLEKLIAKYGKLATNALVFSLYATASDEKALAKNMKTWTARKNPHWSKKHIDMAIGMYLLDLGFPTLQEKKPAGALYLNVDKFVEEYNKLKASDENRSS